MCYNKNMSDNQNDAFTKLDQEKLKTDIKKEAIEAAKEGLISSIQGDKSKFSWEEKGKKAPDSYDELFDEIGKKTVKTEDIDARVEEKLREREDAEIVRAEKARIAKDEEIKKNREQFDKDWYSLVQEGKMPAPGEEVQAKINKGEKLTTEEIMGDEGLKARLELAQITKDKSAKLAYYEDYNKDPAGAKAPVLGARPSSPKNDSKELEYEDVSKNRKKIFGF